MNSKITIRPETEADVAGIFEVTVAAFKTLGMSDHNEQFIIAALREAKALTLSLVAEIDGGVIGHIAFSPVRISDGARNWYGLGPVSVLPGFQGQGIGRALIEEGMSRLIEMEAQGCVLLGHLEYYQKFGFETASPLVLEGVPPEYFLARSFQGEIPRGTVTFHDGFNASADS